MKIKSIQAFIIFVLISLISTTTDADGRKLKVVTTNSAYASIAETIGGDRIEVSYIVKGDQDPHIVRPKPSLAVRLKQADVYVATGMDLEMWSPTLVDMSGNPDIRGGQKGYVSASAGLHVIEKLKTLSRAEGDVHVYGNPHIYTSPLNGKVIAENICVGLKRNAPQYASFFQQNLERFKAEIDRRTFGEELVKLLGGKVLTDLAVSGRLMPFLKKKIYQGVPLVTRLGGWLKEALPLRGRKIVAYHKTIGYLSQLFGFEVVDYLEPKPGIPPSPGHVAEVMDKMRKENIGVMWAENYYDLGVVKKVAAKVDAIPVIVALAPGGQPGLNTFFDQFDTWIRQLRQAFDRVDHKVK